jgi:hypothetical protein
MVDSDEDFAPTQPKLSKMTTEKNIIMRNAQPLPKFNLSENEVFSPLYLFLISKLKNKKRELWRTYLSHIQKETLAESNLDTYGIIYLLDKDQVESHLITDDLFSPQMVSKIKRSELFILLKEGNEVASTWENTYGYATGILTATALAKLFYRAKEEYNKAKKGITKKVQLIKPEPAPQSQLDSKLINFLPQDLVFVNSDLPKSKKGLWLLYLSKIKPAAKTNINLGIYGLIYLLDNNYAVNAIGNVLSHKNVAEFKKKLSNSKVIKSTKWEDTYGYKHHAITNEILYDLFKFYEDQNATALKEANKTKKKPVVLRKGAFKAQRRTKTKPIEVSEIFESQSELDEDNSFLPQNLLDEMNISRSKLWRLYLNKIKENADIKINLSVYGQIYLMNVDTVVNLFGDKIITNKDIANFKIGLMQLTVELPAASTWQQTYGYKMNAITNNSIYELNEFYQHQRQIAERREGKKSHKKQISRKGKASGKGSRKANINTGKGTASGKGSRKANINTGKAKALRKRETDEPEEPEPENTKMDEMKKLAPRKAAPHPDETDETPAPEEKPKRDYETKGKCLNEDYVEIKNPKNEAGEVLAAKACVRSVDEHCKTWIRASNDRLVCAPKLEAKQADKKETCEKFKPKIGDYEWKVETYTNSLGKEKTALNCFKKDCTAWQQSKNGNITCSK